MTSKTAKKNLLPQKWSFFGHFTQKTCQSSSKNELIKNESFLPRFGLKFETLFLARMLPKLTKISPSEGDEVTKNRPKTITAKTVP